MPFVKGKIANPSGRPKGAINKSTQSVRDRILALGNKGPVDYLIATMDNKIPCVTCKGKGQTKFQPKGESSNPGVRDCQSCWGSGMERIAPAASQAAASDLMGYLAPKLKAIEHSIEDGTMQGLADILRARRAKREIEEHS